MSCPRNMSATRANLDFLYYRERDLIRNELFRTNLPFCVWCQEEVGNWRSDNPFTADHVISRHCGGPYALDNLALACKSCNSDRGGLSVLAYMVKRASRLDGHERLAA